MFVAHLSDTHLTSGALGTEPAVRLQRALGRVFGLQIRPDCVVITGDLTDNGIEAEYATLREVLDRFPIPIHLTTGNHDRSKEFESAFAGTGYLGGGSSARYAIEYPEATIIALESKVPDSPAGLLGKTQLAWLDATLARRPDVPAFVCVHHPPMPVGIPYLDGMRLQDGDDLAAVIRRHSHVVRVLSGHVHRPITAGFAGTVLTVAPSTYLQSELNMHPDMPMGYSADPPAFLLHILTGRDCVTHVVPVSGQVGKY